VDWGPTDAHEALDETFCLVTADSVAVFLDPAALPLLQPHLSFWASGDVGLQVRSAGCAARAGCPGVGLRLVALNLAFLQVHSGDEDRKVFEFKVIVHTHLAAGQTVGIPFPTGAVGPEEVERWPLLASFAVEGGLRRGHGTLGAAGFFTLRNPVVDATDALESEIRAVDSLFARQCLGAAVSTFRDHWYGPPFTKRLQPTALAPYVNQGAIIDLTCCSPGRSP